MKFTCEQQQLAKALNTVSKAITTRTTIPILKGILITARGDDTLVLSSSDLDMSIERTLSADVSTEGAIVVPARLFSDMIRKLPAGMIDFELEASEKLIIKTLVSRYEIVSQSAEEFPKTGTIDEIIATLSFDKEMLKEMIKKTQFCASSDETKGVISGVLIEIKEDETNMVALDGFRMAVATEEIKEEKKENLIISARIMNEIGKILQEEEADGEVRMTVSDKKAVIELEKTKAILRMLDGEFIDYRGILPKEKKTEVKINKNILTEAIERASLLTRDIKNRTIKISVKENLMNITSASEEGTVKEDIIMEKSGEDLEIGFNYRYMLDALKAIDDEEIIMEFDSAVKPCFIKPVSGNNYGYLILPVRIPAS